ncbi:phenylalanine--tRNA ligase subunit beta [Candidatus Falkowbacteria bacterium]|nr:phenylalanine--tRNA ligase subunit beta [Candidatus Falkowbacteria bacterium]
MLISLNWLKQHVKLPEDLLAKEIGLKLTMSTVEIDGIKYLGEAFDTIVVGKILKISSHPNADKLRLVEVDLGNEKETVVCGGTNLTEGMLVAFAKIGAKVQWHAAPPISIKRAEQVIGDSGSDAKKLVGRHGQNELVEIVETAIRGVKSRGMICASTEIGLDKIFPPKSEKEILDLSEYKFEVGAPLSVALEMDDALFEVDNKSMTHRPDLWGHYGLARELAALYGAELEEYVLEKIKPTNKESISVEVEAKDLCPRYLASRIDNIKISESPLWLKLKLFKMGVRPINNIVDITNYLLFELGQPMHAFDAQKISGNKIIVRNAYQDENMTTLDGNERKLTKDMLVIADAEKPVALAGIMGALNSEIQDTTASIILESATFRADNIRKTANSFDLRTESAIRFEKSLDPNLALVALQKAIKMIQELCPDAVSSEIVDVKNFELNQGPIEISWDFINSRIGEEMRKEKVVGILEALGFSVSKKRKGLSVKVPTWRATKDISIPEDLVEEVARIIGYDNITPKMPVFELAYNAPDKLQNLIRASRTAIVFGAMATEIYSYSFNAETTLKSLDMNYFNYWQLSNALDSSRRFLRQSLIPNLVEAVVNNLRFSSHINIFEVGKIFAGNFGSDLVSNKGDEKLPEQNTVIGGAIMADDAFFRAKGIVENLADCLNYSVEFQQPSNVEPWQHPQKTIEIFIDKEKIGFVTELHPSKAQTFDIAGALGLWQLDLSKLAQRDSNAIVYKKINKYPTVALDLSFSVDEKVHWADIYKLSMASASNLIKDIELLDVYQSDKIGVGNKSVTMRIIYQADDHTLTNEEAQTAHAKVVDQLAKGVGAQIR